MRRRIAVAATALGALLALPAAAMAAETASVSAGVLTYTSGAGTVDHVALDPGSGPGKHRLSEPYSPSGAVGSGCVVVAMTTVECSDVSTASLATLDGDDRITVTSAIPTSLDGGDGADTLTGGPAGDTILGGDGADVIDARDGVADSVDCGPGTDSVQADAIDVLSNCDLPPVKEPVEPAGDPVLPPGEPPADPPVGLPVDLPTTPPGLPLDVKPPRIDSPVPVTVSVPAEVSVGARGVATFSVGCAADATGGCAGTVFLDPAPRGKKNRPRALAARRGRYGRTRFAAAPGQSAEVQIRLTPSARSALGLPNARKARMARRGRRVKAVVTAKPKGAKAVKASVTLRQ